MEVIQCFCCPVMMWGITFPSSRLRGERFRSARLPTGRLSALCSRSVRGQGLIFQSFWLAWFALIAGAVYQCMSWGLTGLRSSSDEVRSEGNIQHSCAYSEGRGRERPAARLSGSGAAPPFAFIKMFAPVKKQDFPQWPWNGNATREKELDGDNRFVTGREAANPGAKRAVSEDSAGQTISQ